MNNRIAAIAAAVLVLGALAGCSGSPTVTAIVVVVNALLG